MSRSYQEKNSIPGFITKVYAAGTCKVSVHFVIDKHGSMGQIKAMNDPGYDLRKKAEISLHLIQVSGSRRFSAGDK